MIASSEDLYQKWIGRSGVFLMLSSFLLVISQIIGWIFHNGDLIKWAISPVSLVYDILNICGFFLWVAGMTGVFMAFLPRLNLFAATSYFIALLGTLLIMGDVWFESFIVPFVAKEYPVMLGAEPTGTFLVGAILYFAVFSLGWLLFGVSSLVRKMLPLPLGLLIMLGAILGFQPLTPPNLIPLALAIGWMGIWIRKKHGI